MSACLESYWHGHVFFKTMSGVLWHVEAGRWQVLQREGYTDACLAKGGRFYFSWLTLDDAQADLGICAPATCNPEDIEIVLFPVMYRPFLDLIGSTHYSLQVREYRAWNFARALVEAPRGVPPALALLACLAFLGHRVPQAQDNERPVERAPASAPAAEDGERPGERGAAAPASAPAAEDGERPGRGAWPAGLGPLLVLAAAGLALGEVTVRTRWRDYAWHEAHDPLFALGRAAGALGRRALPALRILRLAAAAGPGLGPRAAGAAAPWSGGRSCRAVCSATAARLAELALLAFAWVVAACLVQPTLVVNIFGRDAWNRPGWSQGMVACLNVATRGPPWEAPQLLGLLGLPGGEQEMDGYTAAACPHLEPLRAELQLLAAAAPALLVSPLLGPEAAAALALATWATAGRFGAGALPEHVARDVGPAAAALVAAAALSHAQQGHGVLLLSAGGILAALCMYSRPLAGRDLLPPVLLLAAAPPLAARLLPALAPLEGPSAAALPALPLLLFVIEGNVEPQTKCFSMVDVFVRTSGLLAACLALGALAHAAWRGLAASLGLLAAGLMGRPQRAAMLRLRVDDAEGDAQCSCRLPLPFALLTALALGSAVWLGMPALLAAAGLRVVSAEGPPPRAGPRAEPRADGGAAIA